MKKRIISGFLCVMLLLSLVLPTALAENLKYGSKGSQVTQAQARLGQLGYYKDKVDGKFGFSTYKAVAAFQEKNGLKADGVIGEVTNLALYRSTAIAASGTPSGTTAYQRIAYGSEGPAVKTVQGNLRALGYYSDDVEGKFGSSTYEAVVAFQMARGLKVDGVVGPQTWAALTGSNPVPVVTPKPAPTIPANPTAKHNDKNHLVLLIQQKLHDLGYNVGEVDDLYGYLTVQAVRAFQKANGLKVDGIVGPLTWNKLFGANPVPVTTLPPPVVVPTPAPAPTAQAELRVQYGYTGTQVGQVQYRLIELGYMSTNVVDYVFGCSTYEAVRAFQKNNGLQADGIVGENTWMKLFSETAVPKVTPKPAPATPAATATPKPTSTEFRLQYSDVNADVTELQTLLKNLGYLSTVDGSFGFGTYEAVKAYQKVNGLTADGVVGPKTWGHIHSELALPKPTATPAP